MFCEPEAPCPAHQPKPKKSAARRKTSAPSFASGTGDPVLSQTVIADIQSAMKAAAGGVTETAAEGEAKGRTLDERRRLMGRLEQEKTTHDKEHSELAGDPDFKYALNMLEPILHPDERQRWSDILDTPTSRALRWRERRATS